MPIVCAVNGVAAGAGANLALACDIVVATKSASFIQAFCKIGLIPDSGGTYFLPRLVGTARAMGLAMLGDKSAGGAGGRVGPDLASASTTPSSPRRSTRCCSSSRARRRVALAATKRALYASATATLEAQLDLERDLQRELGGGDDYREGVAAFLDKRAPRFTGA